MMRRPADPLCTYLRQVRTSRGLSQQKLAETIGTNRETLCGWETGLASPTLYWLRRWVTALDLNLTAPGQETDDHAA